MSNHQTFKNIWEAHWNWSKGILITDIIKKDNATFYFSEIPGPYYNFCVPNVTNTADFDIAAVSKVFTDNKKLISIVLFNEHQESGFTEYLLRKGLTFIGTDSWVGYDTNIKPVNSSVDIKEVTPETFKDYYKVLADVFSDFPGNEKYMEICLKTIKNEIHSESVIDLVSKLFVIYDNNVPVAGAGLFYSKKANIAYLHDAGTLKDYRGKGYQSALLKHRTGIALSNGITRIYSSVEEGGKSWSNCIKCGYTCLHTAFIFADREH